MASWNQMNLMNSASPIMEQLLLFHDHTMMIITMITSYMLINTIFNKMTFHFQLQKQTIEIIWTIIRAITLMFIALPSLRLLYLIEDNENPSITVKTIGNQWFLSWNWFMYK